MRHGTPNSDDKLQTQCYCAQKEQLYVRLQCSSAAVQPATKLETVPSMCALVPLYKEGMTSTQKEHLKLGVADHAAAHHVQQQIC